ncbi:MAG: 3-demethylubiquinone-9 3-O-methyltransferase [Chitinophagaceae bacterium]|nr:3-demethylubiquinone-9 3-O-methyltransferase [Chitinophagaceae bacterium]
MPDFSSRSYDKELLDRDDIPFNDIKRNMQELEIINARLGGHGITISGLAEILNGKKDSFSICEIGCGGGDNLKAIDIWCTKKNIPVKLIGIDINKDCIEYAKVNCNKLKSVEFITSDYLRVNFATKKPEIIFSSLFSHHLNDHQFIEMLQWSKQHSTSGFFINDLHRHPVAYYAIKLLSSIFSKSWLVKNDAPLSVRRGFKRKEIVELMQKAGITQFVIKWKWAFRWLITVKY